MDNSDCVRPLLLLLLQMVMVTEPVFGSLQNLQTHFRDVANSTPERASAQLSQLEIKYGMMHVAETVQFLHQEAKLVHCNLNPGSLIVTKDGSWKLSGFAFVGSCDFGGAQGQLTSFEYVSSQPAPWEEYVVVSGAAAAGCSSCHRLFCGLHGLSHLHAPCRSWHVTTQRRSVPHAA
jgi:serine/threonine protein kinase